MAGVDLRQLRRPTWAVCLNRLNPLSKGCTYLSNFEGPAPYDCVSRTLGVPNNSTTLLSGVGALGKALDVSTSDAGNFVTIASSVDLIVPLDRVTIAWIRQRKDEVNRSATHWGATTNFNANMPWSDGLIYWEFGASNPTASYTKISTEVEFFVAIAGPAKGREVWRNGLRILKTADVDVRPAISQAFQVGCAVGNPSDIEYVYYFAVFDSEWTDAQVAEWTRNPFQLFSPLEEYDFFYDPAIIVPLPRFLDATYDLALAPPFQTRFLDATYDLALAPPFQTRFLKATYDLPLPFTVAGPRFFHANYDLPAAFLPQTRYFDAAYDLPAFPMETRHLTATYDLAAFEYQTRHVQVFYDLDAHKTQTRWLDGAYDLTASVLQTRWVDAAYDLDVHKTQTRYLGVKYDLAAYQNQTRFFDVTADLTGADTQTRFLDSTADLAAYEAKTRYFDATSDLAASSLQTRYFDATADVQTWVPQARWLDATADLASYELRTRFLSATYDLQESPVQARYLDATFDHASFITVSRWLDHAADIYAVSPQVRYVDHALDLIAYEPTTRYVDVAYDLAAFTAAYTRWLSAAYNLAAFTPQVRYVDGCYDLSTGESQFRWLDHSNQISAFSSQTRYVSAGFDLGAYELRTRWVDAAFNVAAFDQQTRFFDVQFDLTASITQHRWVDVTFDLSEYATQSRYFDVTFALQVFTAQSRYVDLAFDLLAGQVYYGWAYNTVTKQTSKYEAYNFNSLGSTYGCKEDGIYLLSGATDNGTAIGAFYRTGKSDLSVPERPSREDLVVKNAADFWVTSDMSVMTVEVATESGSAPYTFLPSQSTAVETTKVVLGRGLEGRYWQFTVSNVAGSSGQVEDMQFGYSVGRHMR